MSLLRAGVVAALLAGLALTTACTGAAEPPVPVPAVTAYPGTSEGAQQVAGEFTKPDADPPAILASLRPADEDYLAVFTGDAGVDALVHYGGYWESPDVIGPAPGQTDIRVFAATSEDLAAGTGDAREFPGGYALVAPHLAPGLTFYVLVFSRPGEAAGVRVDGLTHVNGRWRIFPSPWSILELDRPGHQH